MTSTILGIETTCDETAFSIVRDGKDILSDVIASQADLHALYGGVVPELACRRHIEAQIPTLDQALQKANLSLQEIDGIAVAHGPGLIGSLLIGLTTAKMLAFALKKPFIGVNHIEAHLYAAMMPHLNQLRFPSLGLIISGGHTTLVHIKNIGKYELLGTTVDDAIGEAFDKVAKMLNLPYPGGPQIEEKAKLGDPRRFPFKAGKVKKNPLYFSFSGLKTAVLYATKNLSSPLKEQERADLAASFQYAAIADLISKIHLATKQQNFHSLFIGGGVSNNNYLKTILSKAALPFPYFFPQPSLCSDNAAMIAGLGYHKLKNNPQGDPLTLSTETQLFF